MIKQKLIQKRKEKGYSQADMAFKMEMEASGYSRREHGLYGISKKEWDKLARILDTSLEEIYEPQDGVYVINNENANGEYSGSQNHFHTLPDYVLEAMHKYIEKLEGEIEQLKRK